MKQVVDLPTNKFPVAMFLNMHLGLMSKDDMEAHKLVSRKRLRMDKLHHGSEANEGLHRE